jgi:GYF domain 2
MDFDWYVERNGETFGPFTFDRMRKGAREGELRRDDPVWCSALPVWLLAGDIPGLWDPPAQAMAVPPVPPIDDREPEIVHTTPAVGDDASGTQPGIRPPAQTHR